MAMDERRNARRATLTWCGVASLGISLGVGLLIESGVVLALGSSFTENWANGSSPFFSFLMNGGSAIASGVSDGAASDGQAVLLTLPAFPAASPNGGPNIQSTTLYGFGTYEARLRTVDCSAQPNSGVISGFFTYLNDNTDQDGNGVKDNSEIDFEWLCAEPNVIWLTMWTDFQESPLAMKRVYRELDLATGAIRRTCYSEGYGVCTQDLTGNASQGAPATITPIAGYNSASAYHTYGFTWLSNRMTWYVINPANGQKIVLWDYQGPTARITQRPALYMFNAWHTPNWAPPTLPGAVQQPNSPRHMYVDWSKFTASGTPPSPSPGPSPSPSPGPGCSPAWVSSVAYATGALVSRNGQNYQAAYWTQGNDPSVRNGPPGSGEPWNPKGACGGPPPPSPSPSPSPGTGCAPAWVSSTAYQQNAQVSRNGRNYRAAYWTQGNDPAVRNGPAGSGEPWIPLALCQ